MEQITFKLVRGGTRINEFEVAVPDGSISLAKAGLDGSVFKEHNGKLVVTFDIEKPVHDVVRYWMTGEEWEREPSTEGVLVPKVQGAFPWGRRATQNERNGVMILLESPHSSEISPKLVPYVPAAGIETGDAGHQLHQHQAAIIYLMVRRLGIRFVERTPVLVANPLQFPASLRIDPLSGHEALRDAVWVGAMELELFRRNFSERLTRSYPRVIVNACTGEMDDSASPKAITRSLIDQWLRKNSITSVARLTYRRSPGVVKVQTQHVMNPECYIIETPHPCGWRYKPENWFPGDSAYAEWLASRSSKNQ